MYGSIHHTASSDHGEQIVRLPRAGDALGSALRTVYPEGAVLPADIVALLSILDRTPSRRH